MKPNERPDMITKFNQPIEISSWIMISICLIAAYGLPFSPQNRLELSLVAALGALYTLVYYRILIQRTRRLPWVRFIPAFAVIFLLAGVYYLTGSRSEVEVLYVLIISMIGFRFNRKMLPQIPSCFIRRRLSYGA